jgi:hypothetical protein
VALWWMTIHFHARGGALGVQSRGPVRRAEATARGAVYAGFAAGAGAAMTGPAKLGGGSATAGACPAPVQPASSSDASIIDSRGSSTRNDQSVCFAIRGPFFAGNALLSMRRR